MAFSRRWGPTSDWPFRSETILVRRIVGLFPKKKKSHRSWCLASALFSSISKVNKNNGSITQRHHYEQTFGFPGLFGLHKHSNKSNRVRTASTLLPGRFGVDASPFANWEGRLDPIPTRYQVRWKGRNDGNKFYGQDRAPTKKQRKKYHRHLQSVQQEKEKHGKPGYKAGPRREWNQMVKDEILNGDDGDTNNPLLSEEYTMGDALLDDTIGNTIAAADTPEPAYFGHKHRKYFNAVADHMDDYRSYQKQQLLLLSNDGQQQHQPGQSTTSNTSNLPLPVVGLPSDEMIGKVVRAFRDKNGTRRKPVGIIAALSHVIQDLNVPLAALGEYTYTSLLTCCRTPSEARRILQMIREQGLPISAYSWSILTDVYAKSGDYQGCVEVQQEMLQAGVPPTLASFTSLLAACYKVCIDGRVAHAVRAKAASVGWKKWQELRIVGIEPDVMAYGAILRLKAAIGQPEVCVNLIEEMQRFGVAPTTLCFSSALRAVARSHATAIRYEKGHSRRNRRREFLTKHHGQLARHILILAESAGVEQDEGFVSALCLCAAAAGDAATAKAIYVASQIRRLDSLRSIGSNQHLAQLRGENVSIGTETIDLIPSRVERAAPDSLPTELTDMTDRDIIDDLDDLEYATSANQVDTERGVMSFGEREYGKDNRVLTAVLHACAQAVDKNGIGTMWQGRENKGYLCANSLRLIATPKVPVYYDNSIPGQKITDNLTWSGEHTDGYREGKRKSRKFEGVDVDDESGSTLDDLDEMFSSIYLDEDGRRKEEYRSPTHGEIWRMKYGDSWNATNMSDHVDDVRLLGGSIDNGTVKGVFQPNYGNYEIPLERETIITKPSVKSVPGETVEFENPKSELPRHGVSEDIRKKGMAPDMFFDYETMRWKTNDKITKTAFSTGTDMIDSGNSASDDSDNDSSISSSDPDSDAESLDYLEEDIYFDKKERQWKVASKSIIADGLVKPLSPLEKDEDTETLNIIKVGSHFSKTCPSNAVLIARYQSK